MTASGSKSLATIGFLTICEPSEGGLFGGYLVLNSLGRPLEFHCTAPVRPSRAQEILYGPTLRPFLYGEQIGGTLVKKAVSRPLFVCTDVLPALALRDHTQIPVVLVMGDESPADQKETTEHAPSLSRLDVPHRSPPPATPKTLMRFSLGDHQVAVSPCHPADREEIQQRWREKADGLNLFEPFTRIREAIEEAQRGPGRS